MASRQAEQRQATSVVVKVGGSLLALPDLRRRLLDRLNRVRTRRVILIVGGGEAADMVRRLDRTLELETKNAHWLAVRAMTFNSYLLEAILPDSQVVSSLAAYSSVWNAGRVPIQEPVAFLRDEENSTRPPLPHSWAVTSDTIAARLAQAAGARELVLLKSVAWDLRRGLDGAVSEGIIDEYFPREIHQPGGLRVIIEDLRSQR